MAVQKEVISIEAQLDVRNALKNARNLAKELSSLGSTIPGDSLGLTKEIEEAQKSALRLKNILTTSTDSTTGKLNISKFSQQLQSSGKTLEDFRVQLNLLGPQGTAAFNKLATSVASAEKPIRETGKLMNSLMESFANTVKWQISSSAIHGVMSAIQGAYRYAEDLNKSLNDIRIVTGQSTDQMARFAKEANNSAKALSTTTKQYTDASLIYYQQGLSDKEVKQRTDVTIKMANAAGESAKVVSDQLTAVWNNFYDGTKSLEYYADVMTALGAATASSTDEIAQGLEKFAAVSDTVGLSYEYATSALATVTATTRQSADVVGTAFKTIFARLEGLNLGDTLDDGTTLNKYSAALEKVGVNIKTTNGDMKQMDQILDELGARWDKLGQDQRVALAQTVAGTRQYTQLIALMDNWEYFQENLLTAQNSEGTLQEQADIYAESWEGAQKRVKASLESIYQDLINDKFFIKLQNRLAETLGFVKDIVTSLGGVKGLLPGILAIVLKMSVPAGKIGAAIDRGVERFKWSGKQGDQRVDEIKQQAITAINANLNHQLPNTFGAQEQETVLKISEARIKLEERIATLRKETSSSNKQALENEIKVVKERLDIEEEIYQKKLEEMKVATANANKETIKYNKNDVETTKKFLSDTSTVNLQNNDILGRISFINQVRSANNPNIVSNTYLGDLLGQVNNLGTDFGLQFDGNKGVNANDWLMNLGLTEEEQQEASNSIDRFLEVLQSHFQEFLDFISAGGIEIQKSPLFQLLMGIDVNAIETNRTSTAAQLLIGKLEPNLQEKLDEASRGTRGTVNRNARKDAGAKYLSEMYQGFDEEDYKEYFKSSKETGKITAEAIEEYAKERHLKKNSPSKQNRKDADIVKKDADAERDFQQESDNLTKTLENAQPGLIKYKKTFGDVAVGIAQSTGSIVTGIFSLRSIIDALNNDNLTGLEKFKNVVFSLSMGLPAFIKGLDDFNAALDGTLLKIALNIKLDEEKRKEQLLNYFAAKLNVDIQNKENAGLAIRTFLQGQENKGIKKNIVAKIAENLIDEKGNVTLGIKNVLLAIEKALLGDISGIYIALIAVLVALAGVIIYQVVKAWNKDAEALKEAQERTKAVKEETLAAKQAYEDLKTSIADYQEAYNGLNKLVAGTQEFKEALLAANEQAMELITKYSDLQYTVDENGAIKINDKSMDTVLNQQLDELNKKQIQFNATKAIENNDAIKNNKTQFVRNIDDGILQEASYLSTGTAGSVEGLARQVMDKLADEYATADEYEKAAMFGDQYESTINELVGSNIVLGNYLKENIETIKEEIKTNQALADQNAAMAKQNIVNAYESIEAYQKSYIGEALASINVSEYFSEEKITEAAAKLDSQYSRKELAKMYGEEFYGDKYGKAVEGGIQFDELYNSNWQIQKYNVETGKWEDDQEVAVNSLLETYAAAVTQRELAQSEYNAKNNQWEALANKLEEQLLKVEDNVSKILDEDKDTYLTQEAQQKISDLIKDYGTNGQINLYAAGFTEADLAILKDVQTSNQEFNNTLNKAYKSYEEDKVRANYAANEEYAKKLGENQAKRKADIQQATGMSEDAIAIYAELNDLTESQAYYTLELSAAMNKLKKSLSDNSKPIADFVKAQKENTEISAESAVAIGEIRTSLKDLYGVSFSAEEISKNLQLIQEAANGDVEAIENLSGIAAKKMVEDWDINPDLKIDNIQLVTFKQQLIDLANDISGEGIQITPEVNIDKAIESLRELVTAGQITSEQAESYLRRIGYEPVVQKEMVEQETTHALYLGETKLFTITDKYNVEVPMITDASMVGHGITELPSSSDSSSSSGGGTSDTEPLKKIDELDPLADLENQLKSLSHEYDLLGKARDKAYGKGKSDLLKKEIENLKQQEQILKQESNVLAKQLELRAKDAAGLGFEINKDGYVINQDELYTKWLDELEQARLTGNEELYNDAKKTYDKHVEDLNNWNNAVEEIQEKNLEQLDKYTQRLEAELESLTHDFEIKIEIDDRQLEYLEYLLNRLDDSGFDAAARIKNYSQQIEVVTDKALQNRDAIDAILNRWGLTIEDINQMSEDELSKIIINSDDIEKLQEYSSSLMELDEQLRELKETAGEEVLTMIDKYNEDMDKLSSKLDHLTTMTESYQNIVDLIGKDRLGIDDSVLKDLRKAEQAIANEKTALYKRQKDDLQTSEKELQDGLAQAQARLEEAQRNGLSANQLQSYKDDVKYWKEALEEIENDIQETEENLMSSLEASLQLAADDFKATIEEAIKEFEETTLGSAGSTTQLKSSMERIKDEREWYLNDLEKMHDLSKIQRDLDKQMNGAQSQNARNQYLAFQEELDQLAMSGVQVSKQDVDYLTKKLKLTQARIALEESQNNKTMVRMTRNAEGGWGYVYTADADKSAEAQQAYEDALYELGKSSSEYAEQIAEELIFITIEMTEKIQEIMNDAEITDETVRQQKIAEVKDFYSRYLEVLSLQQNKVKLRNTEFATNDLAQFKNAYNEKYNQQKILGEHNITLTDEQLQAIGKLRQADYDSDEAYMEDIAKVTGLNMETVKSLFESGWGDAIKSSTLAEEGIVKANSGITISFNESAAGMATGFESFEEVTNSVAEAMGDPKTGKGLAGAVDKAYKSLENNVDTALEAAGKDTVTFKDELVKQAPLINDEIESIGDEATKTSGDFTNKKTGLPAATGTITDLQEAFSDGASEIGEIAPTYAEGINKITNGTSTLVDLLNILQNNIDYDKIAKGLNTVAGASAPGGSGPQNIPKETPKGVATNSVQSISKFKGKNDANNPGRSIGKTNDGKYFIIGVPNAASASKYQLSEDGTNVTLFNSSGTSLGESKVRDYVIGYGYADDMLKFFPRYVTRNSSGELQGVKFYDEGKTEYYLIHYDDGYYWIKKDTLEDNTDIQKGDLSKAIGKSFMFTKLSGIYPRKSEQLLPQYFKKGEIPDGSSLKNAVNKITPTFDTGGYTGSWGKEGRLAVLHQKELVLNAKDTTNFLGASKILRSVSEKLNLKAAAQKNNGSEAVALASTSGDTDRILRAIESMGKQMNDKMEQIVNITAQFPDARDADEIKRALRDLENEASQFIYRTR